MSGPLPTSLSSSPGRTLKRWPVWFLERVAFFRFSSLPAENLCSQLTAGKCLKDAGLIWNGSFRSESFPKMTLLLPRWYRYQYLSNVTFSDCGSYIFIVENFENFNIILSPHNHWFFFFFFLRCSFVSLYWWGFSTYVNIFKRLIQIAIFGCAGSCCCEQAFSSCSERGLLASCSTRWSLQWLLSLQTQAAGVRLP